MKPVGAVVFLCALLIFCSFDTAFAVSGEPVPPGLYAYAEEGDYNRFTNYVGGYSLLVDKGLQVDMSISGVCATLESTDKRIEIFNQKLGGGISRADYITYSNGFLSNWADHYLDYRGTHEFDGRTVHVTQWHRNKLARVNNDKNYYICLDISMGGSEVITILVSATIPIPDSGGYAYLLSGFHGVEKTAQPYIRKTAANNLSTRNWNGETEAFYTHYLAEDSKLSWGIFEPRAPIGFSHLKEYEEKVAYTFPVILNYSSFENYYKHSNLKERLDNTWAEGRTLELTLQPDWTPAGQSNMVYDVLNGLYDEFLRDYAQTVADFGHPVLFRLGNEMNGDWCSYAGYNTSRDPMIFKEFYRYVHSFFEAANAQNVIWVWNPNGKSFPDFTWNHELMYYPGDAYVDVVGLTAYNTGNYYPGETWTSFATLYDNIYYGYVDRYNKPLMITEFACASAGGDKEQWVREMFAHIRYYDKIKIAVWWDGADYDTNGQVARSYFIDETPGLVELFWRNLSDAWRDRPVDVSWKRDVFA